MLLRPMLGARRAAIRDWLTGQGADWIDDPANADGRYGRSRARLALRTEGGAGSPAPVGAKLKSPSANWTTTNPAPRKSCTGRRAGQHRAHRPLQSTGHVNERTIAFDHHQRGIDLAGMKCSFD